MTRWPDRYVRPCAELVCRTLVLARRPSPVLVCGVVWWYRRDATPVGDTGEALRADGAAAVPHVPPQYRRRFPHIARWSVAAVTPDAVSAVSAGNAYTDAAYKRDKPFWPGLPSGGPRSDSRAPWLSPSPATRRRSTAEPRWLRELAENEELTVRRLACGGHAECMMRALGNSVLRERVMGSSRQGQQLICHGQQPVRGNSLSGATAFMSWATAC